MDDREQRIREKAFLLWLDEGQPEGEHERHWALASEIVAIEMQAAPQADPAQETPALPEEGVAATKDAEVQAEAAPAGQEAQAAAKQETEPAPARSGSLWGSLGFGWGSRNS